MIPRVNGRGGLNEYVSFEKRALDPAGGAAGTGLDASFTVIARGFVKIEGLPGGRYVAGAGNVEQAATHIATANRRADLASFDHLRAADGRLFKVLQAYDPDGGRVWTEMQLQALS